MINKVRIQNYKCLRDVSLKLQDFTVLIGPNDSGKSSFLEVIKHLGSISTRNVFDGDWVFENVVWEKDSKQKIIWEVEGTDGAREFQYYVEFRSPREPANTNEYLKIGNENQWEIKNDHVLFKDQRLMFGSNVSPTILGHLIKNSMPQITMKLRSVEEALKSTLEYQFQISEMTRGSPLESNPSLAPSGKNLASVLDDLQNSAYRQAFEDIQKSLQNAIPTLKGIILPTVEGNSKRIEFVLAGNQNPPRSIPARLASGGALLLTAFLTLAYTDTPSLLLIEEPENGLHPTRLSLVIDILRKISTGEIGNKKRQVIITTHNPLLLNYVRPEEVRVFFRDPDKGTQVKSMDQLEDIDKLLTEFSVGELWYLLGEEKLMEGAKA